MTAPRIVPTIGRVVWYRPCRYDGMVINDEAPSQEKRPVLAAQVAFVHYGGEKVNLMVIDHAGNRFARQSVRLVQEGDTYVDDKAYCEWMPYQKGQAAKTEQLATQLAPLLPSGLSFSVSTDGLWLHGTLPGGAAEAVINLLHLTPEGITSRVFKMLAEQAIAEKYPKTPRP